MDPQQRLLLESSWEALERAGFDPSALGASPTGVYVGVSSQDYSAGVRGPEGELEGYRLTGSSTSVASGRVAYALGLEGPAITVDTACSSSLVAMHLASQALRGGECTLALAGGATVLASPGMFTEFSRQRGLAPDGRSKSFAEAADGVAWAEGVGVLVLERLSDAQRNGHTVHALLKGSAVNQDGASNGLTAPNGPSQERVIRQALANARLEARDVDVVEAHGTGTTLGDPIEAGALLATYGQERERPLRLGSIKSNIGHAQAAAGVAGVIKMALAMREGVLPKTLHVDAPSSKVDWEAGKVELLSEPIEWEPSGGPRRAGVSSFGISGTNAHVILEEAPELVPVGDREEGEGSGASSRQGPAAPVPLVLSAKTEPALAKVAERLVARLEASPELDMTDVAYSLVTTRAALGHRAAVFGSDRDELLDGLRALAAGDSSPNVLTDMAKDGKLAYLFTGQGSQRIGMGRELYEADADFREAFDAICEELAPHLATPLEEVVFASGKKAVRQLDDTTYAQPALFAIEVALYEALARKGLKPDVLAGHSIGEIAAAHVAGVFDLPDAAKLVAARGHLMGALPTGGAMVAVEASEAEAANSIEGNEGDLAIAAINGPRSVVISGSKDAVKAIGAHWKGKGRKTKRLAVSHAFHSPLIEPMLAEFATVADGVNYSAPRVPLVSDVSGKLLSAEQATDPGYWVRQAREPVRFADAIATLQAQGASTYLELGPDPILCAMARERLGEDGARAAFVPTLREGRAEKDAIATALAQAHTAGSTVEWEACFAGAGTRHVPLPTYPFQRRRFWLASAGGGDTSAIVQGDAGRPLLGVDWVGVPLNDEAPAGVELHHCEVVAGVSSAAAAHGAVQSALEAIQGWLAAEHEAESRLALVTRGAIATQDGESPDPAAAAIWGLVRSAQSEHPGRFVLIDSDGSKASIRALKAGLAPANAEPQIAIREGAAFAPRLVRIEGEERDAAIDPERTVLITGATGGLGALVARHLVERHGVRHLLLVSRSGSAADGVDTLPAGLEAEGAEVVLAACDVADREALAGLLDSIPAEHPLGAVIHCAGAIADATVEALSAEQVDSVFAPKVDGAWNLHELTADLSLSAFVLFSSASGTLGGAGQANYAAANVFLDALAQRRRAEGLAASSIAWGLWQGAGGMGEDLGEADLARLRRAGIGTLSGEQGLSYLDAGLAAARSQVLALPLDMAGLESMASAGVLPPIFSDLIRSPERLGTANGALAARLAGLSPAEAQDLVLDLVRAEVALVLGHGAGEEIDPDRAFKQAGFDSLAAVELRNRLSTVAGLALTATAVFDHPTPRRLAEHLLAEASAGGAARRSAVRAQLSDEPVAIVGMACRYPRISSPADLWGLVFTGADAISGFPADRGWDLEHLYDPDPEHPGTSYVRRGGFLADAAGFDAEFFDISPREALAMDPQQRLLLESSWEALEDAGIDPASLRGAPAGVFAGAGYHGYAAAPVADAGELEGYLSTGAAGSVASGRVAYALGLEGPAITVDTACSSSLVAMHLASQALRGGECTLALAGGVTTLATPRVFTEFSRQRGLAPDGRSKSFAEAADGVAWAEGVGVLVLERLSDAQRNGHTVHALLKGSAVNQDGASNGLTAPNGPSQERVIRQALANARLEARDVDVVEAHGTGTTLGDPIEAGALLATYGQERERPLRLGSIKSNIGHAQAAAGVAGVIKMALAMREGVLPKTLHVDAPSSKVDWEAGKVELLSEPIEWEPSGGPRRAGVSSFGISGTNAHVILEEAPELVPVGDREEGEGSGASSRQGPAAPVPLVLSAKTEPALAKVAERLVARLEASPELDMTDVAYSLVTTRAALGHRAAVFGSDRDELLDGLRALAAGDSSPNVLTDMAKDGKLAYLFTGQGSQRIGMGRELYEADASFAKAFDAICEQLDPHLETPLKGIVFAKSKKAEALLEDTTYAQPALFAIEVALYTALAERGLTPDVLTGHSIGEIAAAHIAGVLDLSDAAKLVAARGRLMGALPKGGAMAAIEATEAEVAESIAGKEKELALAAINGPSSTVISGAEDGSRGDPHRVGAEGTQDQTPLCLSRLPLASDGADAGGVRAGHRVPHLQRAKDPDRLRRERRAAHTRAGDKTPPTGLHTYASRCVSQMRSRLYGTGHHHLPGAGP